MTEKADAISQLTDILHRSDDPLWSCLRRLIHAKGLDPLNALLAFSAPQGDNSEFGILVFDSSKIYQYAIFAEASWEEVSDFVEWTNITASWRTSPYVEDIKISLDTAANVYQKDQADG